MSGTDATQRSQQARTATQSRGTSLPLGGASCNPQPLPAVRSAQACLPVVAQSRFRSWPLVLLRALGLSEQRCPEALRGKVLIPRQDMAVGVERDADLRMSDPLRHERHRHTITQEPRRVRVAQVMDPDLLHTGPLHDDLEALQDVVRVEDAPVACTEHEVVVLPECRALAVERLPVLVYAQSRGRGTVNVNCVSGRL